MSSLENVCDVVIHRGGFQIEHYLYNNREIFLKNDMQNEYPLNSIEIQLYVNKTYIVPSFHTTVHGSRNGGFN